MKINKPINLQQLDQELNGKGLNATLDKNKNIIEITLADNNDANEEELANAINAHIAKATPEPSIEQKLASVGLTIDDLKAALGL